MMIGYRSIIEGGFQHRDISIGNVLWFETAQKTQSVFNSFQSRQASPNSNKALLKAELERCGVNDLCYGWVIDGDMSIAFKRYIEDGRQKIRSV